MGSIFGSFMIVAILGAVLAVITHLSRRFVKDSRTLWLGRWAILEILFWLLAVNGLLAAFVGNVALGTTMLLVIAIEAVALIIVPLIVGLIAPILVAVLSWRAWQREQRTIANLLLPILVLVLVVITFVYNIISNLSDDWLWLRILAMSYPLVGLYLGSEFLTYFVASYVYGRRMRKQHAPYNVILGAGLINGNQVSPLLGRRIKAGVDHAGADAKLVFSGGKGSDEQLAEGVAMQEYAVNELGVPA